MLSSLAFIARYGGIVLRLGPIFISVVRAVESLRDGTVSGTQKKEIAVKTLESILLIFGYSMTASVRSMVNHGIELAVAVLTVTGEFRSKWFKAVSSEIPVPDVPKQVINVSEMVISNKVKLEQIKTLMNK
jgi:hypothetical protein